MSIIYGIFNRNKVFIEKSKTSPIIAAFSSWKIDNQGAWKEDAVFLGHMMLWSTPESKLESLPSAIVFKNNALVITADIRLDNREVLANKLDMLDTPLESITDSTIILEAYKKWGKECPKYLLGDFAFVIWDESKQQIFCARDHIGIKPFYYYLSNDLFVFSNVIDGVISHPEVSKKYNDRSIAMFLAGDFGFYDKNETFFSEVKKLEAATSMIITQDSTSKSTYWNIKDIPKVQYNTYEEYVKELRALLIDAVQVRLRSTYPVASHMSGGIDSSSIAVLASRELKKRKQTLYAFNWAETPQERYDPNYSEWGFATKLANLEDIEQKDIKLTAEYIAVLYDQIDITKDDSSYIWREYLVRDEAEKYGVRTILSGWGGDELISYSGRAYLSGLFWQGHYFKAIQEILILYKDKRYKYLRIIKRLLREMIYTMFYRRMDGLYKEKRKNIDKFEFAQKSFSSFGRNVSFKKFKFHPGAHNDQRALFNQGHILQRIENWASPAYKKGIEYSYPLLDKRIVEFSLAVPEDLFARKEGYQRYFFRSAISVFLPYEIAWAVKNNDQKQGEVCKNTVFKSLQVWLQRNKDIYENKNDYIERKKIINRIKTYLENKDKQEESWIGSSIISSILVSNLKKKDC
jgi:asparagine synthase (glutamine-hydrolysing)